MPKTSKHWNYFLTAEAELANCARFVEFSQENYSCYSNELAKIIILAAGEVDSIWHDLCRILNPSACAKNISSYRPLIYDRYPLLSQCKVAIPRYQLTICPWADWSEDMRPAWWSKSYNKLKHERFSYFRNATLEAALCAVGAQFLALQLYHHAKFGEHLDVDLSMRSALFAPGGAESFKGGACWRYGDPFAHLTSPAA